MTRRYSFFMLLQGTPRWRALEPAAQHAHHDALLLRVFDFPDLQLRRFDSAAFGGRCSDVLLWETGDVAQYYEALGALRECGLLDAAWFDVVDVIPAIEDAWRDDEPALPPALCVP